MSTKPVTLESFEDQCLELMQEAFSVRGSIRDLGDKLNAFSNSFRQFITETFVNEDPQTGLLNENAFRKLSKSGDYMAIRNKKVMVPKGLNVSYLDHLKTLHESQKHVDDLFEAVLNPIERFLGVLLNDPDNLKSQREAGIIDLVVKRDVEALQKQVAKDFSTDRAEHRPYGMLIGRQSDWAKIASTFNDLSESIVRIPREDVLKKVTTIGEHLQILIERLEEDPEIYAANGVGIANMAKVSYAVASEVEFYAMHAFMVEALQASLEDAAEIARNKE